MTDIWVVSTNSGQQTMPDEPTAVHDATFIAATSPNVVLALIERVRVAEAAVARVEALADDCERRNEYGDASLGLYARWLRAALVAPACQKGQP